MILLDRGDFVLHQQYAKHLVVAVGKMSVVATRKLSVVVGN